MRRNQTRSSEPGELIPAHCRHPLFPLLAFLFDKCEEATQSAVCPSSDSFRADVQLFVQTQIAEEGKPRVSDNREADELVRRSHFASPTDITDYVFPFR